MHLPQVRQRCVTFHKVAVLDARSRMGVALNAIASDQPDDIPRGFAKAVLRITSNRNNVWEISRHCLPILFSAYSPEEEQERHISGCDAAQNE
jgi:hypothetical protein